jgi:hypothetical protein
MTDKELKRLNRRELLEVLLEQSRQMDEMKQKLEKAEAELEDRKIKLEKAGSIAEAALQLNHIFEAADEAARQYIENVKAMDEKRSED